MQLLYITATSAAAAVGQLPAQASQPQVMLFITLQTTTGNAAQKKFSK